MNVPHIASNARLAPSLPKDQASETLAWEALLAARASLKHKRRYRLWHRLNKPEK